MNSKSSIGKRIISLLLASIMLLMHTHLIQAQAQGEDEAKKVKNEGVYIGDGYEIDFKITSQWKDGFNADVTITNTSDTVIDNWAIGFEMSNEISNIRNAQILKTKDNEFIIKNANWNQDIPINGSVNFGFTGKGKLLQFPSEYEMPCKINEIKDEDYIAEFILDSSWDKGFTGKINITNNSEKVLEDWILEFDFDKDITNIWNGIIESHEGNHYVISNANYNSNISPKETVSFGFCGNDGIKQEEPFSYKLYTYEIDKFNTIVFDLNHENSLDSINPQMIKEGELAITPERPQREGHAFMGWYEDKDFSNYFDFESNIIDEDITLYARWLNYNDKSDTDSDGLPDSIEEIFGTNPLSVDTDGDGLSDYIEIVSLGLDPIKMDTDNNGTKDGDEDNDSDGLTNIKEIDYDTDPNVMDTDDDGLNDYEEIYIYGTDPLNPDTDGDGVFDGKEIELMTDPLIAQESFNVSETSKDIGSVKASVSVKLSGEQVETLSVDQTNSTFFNSDIPGYVGEAYDFNVDGSFDSATINFEFDSQLLEDEDFEPIIYYFNEEEQKLEAVETDINGNIASAVVEHFSTYILINRIVFEKSFTWIDVWDANNYAGVEIVLVIDDSGSMYSNDRNNDRLKVAQSLVDNLPSNSKIGVVKFTNSTSILTSTLTDNKEIVNSYLTTSYFRSSGGTYMYNAINSALSLYGSTDDSMLKVMVVLSDGVTSDSSKHSATVLAAQNKGVNVYTVGLGDNNSSYFNNYLKPLAEDTGGAFYLASNASQLTEIYNDINQKIDIETDSDGDGIPDYYEENMTIFNGVKMQLDKNNPDTDGDGLLDGKEIVDLIHYYSPDKSKVIVIGKMESNPTKIDSDDDGLYDNSYRKIKSSKGKEIVVAPIDPNPLKANGPTGIWERQATLKEKEVISTEYTDGRGLDVDEITELIRDAIGKDFPNNKEIADTIVELIIKLRDPLNDNEEIIRPMALLVKYFSRTKAHEVVGAYFLNFIYDADYVAYHSQPETWQRYFGFNDFYDDVFRIATNMNNLPFNFSVGKEDYALWMWKGDYWNLHSGAEIGLYVSPTEYSGTKHYDVIDFELPMTLSLYNYDSNDADKTDCLFRWAPEVKQWWVTGFNPKYKDPNPNVMVAVGSIDFTGYEDIYNGLKSAKNDYDVDKKKSYEDYLIFDDYNYTVWINWYKGVK